MAEASRLANILIDIERRDGLDTAGAIERAERRWQFDHHTLYRLRYRARELDDVKASTLENLREAYEEIYERQRRRAEAELEIEREIERIPHNDQSTEQP